MPTSTRNSKKAKKSRAAASLSDSEGEDPHQAKKLKEMEAKMEELKALNDDLTKHAETIRACKGSKKLLKKSMNKADCDQIMEAIKSHNIWGKVKFVGPKHAEKFIDMVFKEVGLGSHDKARETLWKEAYGDFVIEGLNKHRQYVQGLLRVPVLNFAEAHNGDIPTMEIMEKCLSRDIDVNNPVEMALFQWYWDKYLPEEAGNGHIFKESQRHYATISEAAPLSDPNAKYMPSVGEALAVLMYENNRERWLHYIKLKKEYGHDMKVTPAIYLPDKPKTDQYRGKPGEVIIRGDRMYVYEFKGKFTVSDGGQAKYGGWTNEGLKRFQELKKMAKEGRAKPNCGEIEKLSLGELRAKKGLTASTHAEHIASNNKKKKSANPVENIIETWSDSDDDEQP